VGENFQIFAKLFLLGEIMKFFVQIVVFLISSLLSSSQVYAEQSNKLTGNLKIISIYQIEDEISAGFDFFTSQKNHKCGGKPSNRYRSYSDHKETTNRKFQLILAALNHQHKVTIKPLGCEGRAMLVDYIGISS